MYKTMLMFILLIGGSVFGQNKKIPDIKIKKMNGTMVSATTIANGEDLVVIIFWSTTCHHSINCLNEISDVYDDWQEESNAKVVIICTDDKRSSGKVPAFVNGNGWEFSSYLDENGDFRRAMNVSRAPHVLILDQQSNVLFNQTSINVGDEEVIYKVIEK